MATDRDADNRPASSQDRPPVYTFEMDDSVTTDGGQYHIRSVDGVVAAMPGKDPKPTKMAGPARHTIGLLLLLFVVFMWTASNFLGSSIFADDSYAKPFFLTYLNTSMFMIAMIPRLLISAVRKHRDGTLRDTLRSALRLKTYRPLWRKEVQESEGENFLKPDQDNPSQTGRSVGRPGELGVMATARMSMAFCILWFAANYFAMACLEHTTVASATILTSTSSVWTLLIGAITRIEKFTWRKLCGVIASLVGIILISRIDLTTPSSTPPPAAAPSSNSPDSHKHTARSYLLPRSNEFPDKPASELAVGDCLALLSAVIYGFYTITLKKTSLAAAPQELNMSLFFGFVGLFNFVFLLPLFPILHFTNMERFELPPSGYIWAILIINSVASLLSDICWAYAMVMTSPLLVTVGLSLTIPLSLIGEMVIQSRYEGWLYWVGASIVVGSFVFVEREEVKEEKDDPTISPAEIRGEVSASSPVVQRRASGFETVDFENNPSARLLGDVRNEDDLEGQDIKDGKFVGGLDEERRRSSITSPVLERMATNESHRRGSSVGGSYNSISGPEGYRIS